MYLNSFQLGHVFFSETRAYMALVMGATMALIMLTYMRRMYRDRRLNSAIVLGSVWYLLSRFGSSGARRRWKTSPT
jgi:hypothetical protein